MSSLVQHGLGIPLVRYPLSRFGSAYEWELGTRPQESRPRVLDLV